MKEFQEEIYEMYVVYNMSIRDIALDAGISTEEVKEIIAFMSSLG
jgi:hypothetical protein